MANDLWNIFLNIVAAFIYAGIVTLWKDRKEYFQETFKAAEKPPLKKSEAPSDNPVNKRSTFLETLKVFLFHLLTFAVLYFSITMPLLFKALFSKEALLLNQARYIGEYLPAIEVGKEILQLSFFLVAAILYPIIMYVSNFLAFLFHPIVKIFLDVTRKIHRLISLFLFIVFCIPISATSIWLFYEKSFEDSLIVVLVFMFFMFAVISSQEKK